MNAACGAQDRRLDVVRRHGLNPGEKRPLVRVGPQRTIHKDAAAAFARVLLERQGDQVAEATDTGAARPRLTGRHRVLVGKQAVVRRQLELPGARAGVADDGGAQASGITRRHTAAEEHPCMCPLA